MRAESGEGREGEEGWGGEERVDEGGGGGVRE